MSDFTTIAVRTGTVERMRLLATQIGVASKTLYRNDDERLTALIESVDQHANHQPPAAQDATGVLTPSPR